MAILPYTTWALTGACRCTEKYWDPVRVGSDGSRRVPDVVCTHPHSGIEYVIDARIFWNTMSDGAKGYAAYDYAGWGGTGTVLLYRYWYGTGTVRYWNSLPYGTIWYSCEITSHLQFLSHTEIPIYAQNLLHSTK